MARVQSIDRRKENIRILRNYDLSTCKTKIAKHELSSAIKKLLLHFTINNNNLFDLYVAS